MRKPRDKRSFVEFYTVKEFKSTEITVEHVDLEGDLRVALIFQILMKWQPRVLASTWCGSGSTESQK